MLIKSFHHTYNSSFGGITRKENIPPNYFFPKEKNPDLNSLLLHAISNNFILNYICKDPKSSYAQTNFFKFAQTSFLPQNPIKFNDFIKNNPDCFDYRLYISKSRIKKILQDEDSVCIVSNKIQLETTEALQFPSEFEDFNQTLKWVNEVFNKTLCLNKPAFKSQLADGKKVYSQFNSNFLNNLDLNKLPKLPEKSAYLFTPKNSGHDNTYLKGLDASNLILKFTGFPTFSRDSAPPAKEICNNNPILTTSEDRIDSLCSTHSLFNKSISHFLEELIYPENFNDSSHIIFHIPSWMRKSNKPMGFRLATSSFVNKRKGIFYPVLAPTIILNSYFEEELVYFLVLVHLSNDSLINQVRTKKAPANAFFDFISKYSFSDSIFFVDELAYKKAIGNHYKNLNPLINLETIENPEANAFLQFLSKNTQLQNYKPNQSFASISQEIKNELSIKIQPNFILLKKLRKIESKFFKDLSNFNKGLSSFLSNMIHTCNIYHSIYLKTLTVVNTDLDINHLLLNKYSSSYHKNQKYIRSAYENENFCLDSFIDNMEENKIKILNISYDQKKITSMKILIDKPVKIYVDSKATPKAIKVGGPYLVEVSQSSLFISLKDANSFFGLDGNRIYVHPHSSRLQSDRNDIFQKTNACLGEAQALIYNAFKDNCYKKIIMAALTWVTSANSADVWGRGFRYFLDYSSILQPDSQEEVSSEETITTEEVSNFLDAVIEETPSEESSLAEPQPVQRRSFTSEDFTQPVNNYTPVFNPS